MLQVAEFRGKEIAFLRKDRKNPRRGYQITDSQNYETLKKMLNTEKDQYNTYVSIETYNNFPKLPFAPKKHWPAWKQWIENPDKKIKSIDFFLDFDSEPSIEGIIKAWSDVQMALKILPAILGEQTKYLTIYFSGNKGFHILGKTKIITTPQENIEKQIQIAKELKMVCPTLDITVYNLGRLRKLLGSPVYSTTFGKTRVIPIPNNKEFKGLITALKTKNTEWFENKQLIRTNNINITGVDKK